MRIYDFGKKMIIIKIIMATILLVTFIAFDSINVHDVTTKYPQLIIQNDELSNGDLKDFRLSENGNLISESDDPWVYFTLPKSICIKEISVIVDSVNPENAWSEIHFILNTNEWIYQGYNVKTGINKIKINDENKLNNVSQIRFDLLCQNNAEINVKQITINDKMDLTFKYHILYSVVFGILFIIIFWIKKIKIYMEQKMAFWAGCKNNIMQKNLMGRFLLKWYICLALLFPFFYAQFDSPYYPELTIANLFVVIYILWAILYGRRKKINKFISYLIVLLATYNIVAFVINIMQSGWFWEQINVSFAFGFFIILLSYKTIDIDNWKNIIRFLIILSVLTTIIGIIVYCAGYRTILLMNNSVTLIAANNSRNRFSWLYSHKSQYGLILLLFISLIYAYRKEFKNKFVFYIYNLVFFIALINSYSYTALLASLYDGHARVLW